MQYIVAFTLPLILAVELASAASLVPVTETTKFYSIHGETTAELRSSIRKNRPKNKTLGNFDAYTDWKIHYGYSIIKKGSKCRVKKPDIKVVITFVMPKFDRVNRAPRALRAEWKRYYHELTKHEHEHRDIAVEAGNEIKRMLTALPTNISCTSLERIIDDRAAAINHRYKAKQERFDAETDFGRATGAVLR